MTDKYIKKILEARVYDVARETPLEYASNLSRRLGNRVMMKREDMQSVFSFKCRGAYNKIYMLASKQDLKGVIAASAGNHAQGVALAASKLDIPATIVMPKTTPSIKIAAVKALGARIILHGDAYDDAYAHAQALAADNDMAFIHPYDDPDVIAGQGTVGMEILHQCNDPLHAIFVPVGGGGLIAGIAAYVKYLRPEVKVIGVEPEDAACMAVALAKGRRVVLDRVGIFADGVAVRQVGRENFRIARRCVDEIVTVSTDEICAAIKDIFDDTRTIMEPAGSLAVAGVKKYVAERNISDQTMVVINSGANLNFDRLRHISERAELGERREALLAVTIPEKPGSFRTFCKTIGKRGITEFNYRYSDAADAQVFAGIQLNDGMQEKDELVAKLEENGYPVVDLSDNEMAKIHVRHMVGGRNAHIDNETLYRFEFPERPGALLDFLTSIGKRWNISLFHYRNHGAAYGRVLAGMQIPPQERHELGVYLDKLGYPYWEETDNPAYRLFLSD